MNDVQIACFSIAGSTVVTGLTGFTQIESQEFTGASFAADTWVGWKRLTADTAATNATLSLTGGQYGSHMVRTYRGCYLGSSPVFSSALFAPLTATSGTTKDSAALGGLNSGMLCVIAWLMAAPNGTLLTGVTGTGVTNFDSQSNYGNVAMVEAPPSGSGAAPIATCTSNNATNTWGGITLALRA